jgi:hypothetical protein
MATMSEQMSGEQPVIRPRAQAAQHKVFREEL